MLKKLAKRINWEIEQAEDYCEQAMLVKHKSAQVADLFATLSSEEIVHAEKLLKEGQRLVDDNKAYSYGEEVKDENEKAWHEKCKVIWEWEHRMAMDRISEIQYKLSLYRSR